MNDDVECVRLKQDDFMLKLRRLLRHEASA